MRFFFVEDEPAEHFGPWSPSANLKRHLKALRLGAGDEFLLLLPLGGAIRATTDGRGAVELHGLVEIPRLRLFPVTLASAWPKGNRADELIQRATELGVERLIPLQCARSVAGRQPFRADRIQRWKRLIRESCQQCGRPVPMQLETRPRRLDELPQEAPKAHPIALVPDSWPLAQELGLHTPREVLLITGPEGGFDEEELAWMESHEVHRAGLMPTTLRIEVAGPFAAGLCQHWFEETQSR